jgi:hypothetical protein
VELYGPMARNLEIITAYVNLYGLTSVQRSSSEKVAKCLTEAEFSTYPNDQHNHEKIWITARAVSQKPFTNSKYTMKYVMIVMSEGQSFKK